MIPNEIKIALDTINKYRKELSDSLVTKEYICICCRENIMKPLYANIINPFHQEREMWDNGVVTKITCGYGSEFDLESFYIGICDACLKKAFEDKLIVSLREIRKHMRIRIKDLNVPKEIFED